MDTENKEGIEIRRAIMGEPFVERAMTNATPFTEPLQEFINEHAWGGVWARLQAQSAGDVVRVLIGKTHHEALALKLGGLTNC